MTSDTLAELLAAGWTKRFSASGVRLQEGIENYEALELEVKTVPVLELGGGGCMTCFEDENDRTMMIFTRGPKDER
jgi:hypothetical protein